MTSSNRRSVARVRNALLGATALAGFAALSTPASAIVINDQFTPTQVVDTTNVTGVGQMVVDEQNGFIGLCTVSLINPRTVIFASHCVNENPAESAFMPATGYGTANGGLPIGFFFNANNNQAGNSAIGQWLNGGHLTNTANFAYNSNFVVYNTNCCTIGLGNNFLQSDIAMAALDTPAVGIPTWTLLFSPLSAPAHATIEGYGDNGIGSTGQGTIDFKRRVAENIVSLLGSLDDQDSAIFGAPDGLPANLYMADFNDPNFNTAQANVFDFNIFHDTATPKEGITAPGDSGGPLVIDHQFAAPTIAAVLSGGDRFFNAQPGASYGTTSFYQPLYLYWDWILANNPYKYVASTGGNHNWHDAGAFAMALDPAYLTIDAQGNTINALPTTPALGQADVAPGFGEVCYFDDCVNIVTGVETKNTPPPGANPANASRPFGGLLGTQGFVSFVQMFAAANGTQDCGAAIVSVDALTNGNMSAQQQTCVAGQAGAGSGSASASGSAQSDWTNPEGFAHVGDPNGGEDVQGAPGASPGQVVNNQDANVATGAPARYYDVTLAANGTTTLTDDITVDKLTINGPLVALEIAKGASLTTNIASNVFAGTLSVDGTLTADGGGLMMFGGLLQGDGTINGDVGFLLGAVSPGTNGTIGTLTVNGNVVLSAGATTVIDISDLGSDLLVTSQPIALNGTLVFNYDTAPRDGEVRAFIEAPAITGDFLVKPSDVNGGVLKIDYSTVTVNGNEEEVATFTAGSFATLLGESATPDQLTIANALDAERAAGNYNKLVGLFGVLDLLDPADVSAALEHIAPDAERAATLVGDMTTTGYDNMIWQHLAESGASQPETQMTAGLHVNSDGLRMAMASASGHTSATQQLIGLGMGLATNPGAADIGIPGTGQGTAAAPSPSSGSWMDLPGGLGGFVSGSSLDGSVSIGGGGGRADVRGLIVGGGFDMPVADGLTVGASFGYSDAKATLRTAPATLQSNSLQGGLYARYDFGDHWIAEGFGSYGHQTITTRRAVVVGPTVFLLEGHSGGDAPSVGGYIGRSFDLATLGGSTLNLVPSFSLQYLGSEIDPFSEVGGAPAMSFADYSEASTLSRLGFDAKMTFDLFGMVHITPNAHAFWVDNFEGNNSSIEATFAAAPGPIMTFAQATRDRSYGELGVGLDLDLSDYLGTGAVLSGRYDANTRDDVQFSAWTGRLSFRF